MATERKSGEEQPAKPYRKPELKEFGTIAELTALLGNMGASDGGIAPEHKSQL